MAAWDSLQKGCTSAIHSNLLINFAEVLIVGVVLHRTNSRNNFSVKVYEKVLGCFECDIIGASVESVCVLFLVQ